MWNEISPVEPGSRPGQISEQKTEAHLLLARYSAQELDVEDVESFAALPAPLEGETQWLDIQGVPGDQGLRALQEAYSLHHLALEDVQRGGQSPKLESFDQHLYLVLQLPYLHQGEVEFEQINFFLARNMLITVQPRQSLFDPVLERLGSGRGIIRASGPEYLLYALADLVVDWGFPVAQALSETLLELESRVEAGDADLSHEIYAVRRQLSILQRQSFRQREQIRRFLVPTYELLSGEFEVYWRDCVDHADRLSDNATYLRESAADLLNTHLALISHRMNDVMKVLTIMSTVFVPLSFLVGLYGMNFDTSSTFNMPELSWRFGYLYIWGLMLVVVGGVLLFFRHKKWI